MIPLQYKVMEVRLRRKLVEYWVPSEYIKKPRKEHRFVKSFRLTKDMVNSTYNSWEPVLKKQEYVVYMILGNYRTRRLPIKLMYEYEAEAYVKKANNKSYNANYRYMREEEYEAILQRNKQRRGLSNDLQQRLSRPIL